MILLTAPRLLPWRRNLLLVLAGRRRDGPRDSRADRPSDRPPNKRLKLAGGDDASGGGAFAPPRARSVLHRPRAGAPTAPPFHAPSYVDAPSRAISTSFV